MKSFLVAAICMVCSWALYANWQSDHGRIYFFGDLVGPGINVFSVDLDHKVQQHTADLGSRDIDFALDQQGNLLVTSNRVLDRASTPDSSRPRKSGQPQDFNIYWLPNHTFEQEKQHLATPMVKTDVPETQGNLSANGKWLSYVRTIEQQPGQYREQLMLRNLATNKEQLITEDEFIIASDWSQDSNKLVFSSHSYQQHMAQLKSYLVNEQQHVALLASDTEQVQIDAPKWSPDGQYIAFIKHPLEQNKTRQLFVMDTKTGELKLISNPQVQVQAPVSWAQDSKTLVYSALVNYRQYWNDEYRRKMYEGGAQVFISDLNGKVQQLTEGDTQMHMQPVFSPDSKLIAYMYAKEAPGISGELRVIDLHGKLVATLYDRVSGMGYMKWQ